jgi:hypothetical protein
MFVAGNGVGVVSTAGATAAAALVTAFEPLDKSPPSSPNIRCRAGCSGRNKSQSSSSKASRAPTPMAMSFPPRRRFLGSSLITRKASVQ